MSPDLTPLDWAKRPIEKYADFTGRAPRAEYWWFALAWIVAFIVLGIIESIIGINHMVLGVYGPLRALLWLAIIIPSIAVGVRRLHDTNRTGWWVVLPIIPYALAIILGGPAVLAGGLTAGLGLAALFLFIGLACAVALLVFMVLPGTPGENRFGPNPYGGTAGPVAAE